VNLLANFTLSKMFGDPHALQRKNEKFVHRFTFRATSQPRDDDRGGQLHGISGRRIFGGRQSRFTRDAEVFFSCS
jgi:hypothetical protein